MQGKIGLTTSVLNLNLCSCKSAIKVNSSATTEGLLTNYIKYNYKGFECIAFNSFNFIKLPPLADTTCLMLGRTLPGVLIQRLSQEKSISLICGHFEGVDERLLATRNIEEISIGDFILSGGETAVFVILDSILRLLPGVLGNENSKNEESFENGLLEYPQYTKPQIWEEKSVPDVLLSGDHSKIKDWRLSQSEAITRVRRPDLWKKYNKN